MVASDESSVPVSFTVTDLPPYGVMSIVFSTYPDAALTLEYVAFVVVTPPLVACTVSLS